MNPSEKWTRFSPDSLCSRVYLIIIIFNRAAFRGEGVQGGAIAPLLDVFRKCGSGLGTSAGSVAPATCIL